MNAIFLETTNPKFEYIKGEEGNLEIERRAYFSHGMLGHKFFTSSLLIEAIFELQDDSSSIVTFTTLNSVYKFRILGV